MWWPSTNVNLELEGEDEDMLVSDFTAAARHTAAQLDDLKLPLAAEKALTLGSSLRIADRVARSLGYGSSAGTTV